MTSMTAPYSPVINGIHQGSLVEVFGIQDAVDEKVTPALNGQKGQLTEYADGMFGLAMLNTGEFLQIDPKFVRACTELQKPGQGGDADSFDIIIGPKTKRNVLGDEISRCLTEKGFCIVKTMQESTATEAALESLGELEASGQFARLSRELEEGYLGRGGRAKVSWLNPEGDDSMPELIYNADYNMTSIAEVLQPFCEAVLGSPVAERTPALVCRSMTDKEEEQYTRPDVDDQELLEYYNTWSRSVLRVVQYLGPSDGSMGLEPKANSPLKDLQSEYTIAGSAGTIVIVREDVFECFHDDPDEGVSSWLQCFLLNPAPEFNFGELEEDQLKSILKTDKETGPPPPTSGHVAVNSIAIQAAGGMANSPSEWAAYTAGVDAQVEFPLMRFDYKPYYGDDEDIGMVGGTYVKHCSYQEGSDQFDNRIFEISNAEATSLDPQNRQVLEVGLSCLVKIGIDKKYANKTQTHASISVGCDKNEWAHTDLGVASVAVNNQLAICANRFNYVFNMKGGSYVCDTACSSALVAAHLGKVNLLEQRWDPLEFHLAIGTNLSLTLGSWIGSCASHMMGLLGRCLTFNASATGYNRGDGTGGLLLQTGKHDDKRLAFLRGTQIGNDGRSASMSAPNGPAQEKCIWGAVREAMMTPPESTVWECHGTGTSLGDPIEVGSVRKVQIKAPRKEPLMIATSKSNLGHLEGAASALGLVKCAMLVIKTKCLPTIHLNVLNPHLEHSAFEAFYATEHLDYFYSQGHAQVSSFGVGGTNGHGIMWGEDLGMSRHVDVQQLFLKKLHFQKPKVVASGASPVDWDYSGPDIKAKAGDKYKVVIEKDPITGQTPIRWEKIEEVEEKQASSYSIVGSFNEWSSEQMAAGTIPGLFYHEATVPGSGSFTFRFLINGDSKQAWGPEEERCTSRTAPFAAVSSDLKTFWQVTGNVGDAMRIELLAPPGAPPSVNWFKWSRRRALEE